MKIVHVITGLTVGGAERALFNLLNGGIAEHFNCHVISLLDEGIMGKEIRALGVPVSDLGMRSGSLSINSLRKLYKVVQEFKPDIIQGWMYHGNLAATIACVMAPGTPILVWNIRHSLYDLGHERSMTQKMISLNRFFSSRPAALLYNSQLSQRQHEAFGFSSEQGQVIPNGIDIQKFSFSVLYRQKVRAELGIPENALVVGHVARLHPIKDHPLFLKTAVDIAQRDSSVHFLLSGRDVSIENKDIEQLVPMKLRNRFHFLGERADVPELMCAMDIFCLSSWGEAFPNVLGEAMAVGVPCVATDVGDVKLIIGECGVVVPPRDKDALAAGIESLLMLEPAKRHLLGQQAHKRIEDKFTLGAIVGRYVELYRYLK